MKALKSVMVSGAVVLGLSGFATAGSLNVPVSWDHAQGRAQDFYYVLSMTDQNGITDTYTLTPTAGSDSVTVKDIPAGEYTVNSWAYRVYPGLGNKVKRLDYGPQALSGTVKISDTGSTVFSKTLNIGRYYDEGKFVTEASFI
ncbi:hypothetical protein [Gynuella sp.]|uniref:hypothetical protein n=1 Tax=Gynuella sp. TaxID=2969146 RepID=UPI003D142734